jgi:hypothetical protein
MTRLLVLAVAIWAAGCGEKRKATVNHNSAAPADGAAPARSARGNGLELRARVTGTAIEATLVNVGEVSRTIVSQVDGPDRKHYDAFVVRLGGAAGERELRFTGDRNASDSPLVVLAPGQAANHHLDLVAWSTAPINPGGPLAAGDYLATVIYRVAPGGTWWVGELTVGDLAVAIP